MSSVSAKNDNFPNIHNLLYSIYDIARVPVGLIMPDSTKVSILNSDSICNSFYCNAPHTLKKCEQSRSLLFNNPEIL